MQRTHTRRLIALAAQTSLCLGTVLLPLVSSAMNLTVVPQPQACAPAQPLTWWPMRKSWKKRL